ncbi:MAG: carbohydrate porin, partial [Lentisphaeraceae bacterium]|nr:carbohydrate porin [Lentisphaeraceae bacterium]
MKNLLIFIFAFSFFFPDLQAEFSLSSDGHTLGFHGYARIGKGYSSAGHQMAEFIAPGASSKYRLGNEANFYYELSLKYHYVFDQQNQDTSPYLEAQVMVYEYELYGKSEDLGIDGYNQAYILLGNILNGKALWFGRRFYDRKHSHIGDYFSIRPNVKAD